MSSKSKRKLSASQRRELRRNNPAAGNSLPTQTITVSHQTYSQHIGPLPPAEYFEQVNAVCPGAAQTIREAVGRLLNAK